MKKIRNILSSLTVVLLTVAALSFSGRYVAFVSTCEGMGTQKVSINEKQSCCCSEDENTQADNSGIAIQSDGCCKVEVKGLSVDDFSFNLKKVTFDSSDYTIVPFAIAATLDSTCAIPQQYAAFTPPDVGPRTGTDIIFTISRQLRI